MKSGAWWVLVAWLLAMTLGVWVAVNSRYTADMSFFLPRDPTPGQQVLVDQVKEGAVARVLMVAIQGGDSIQRAQASQALAERLKATGRYASVQNGQQGSDQAEREFLLKHRYLLSPSVEPQRFEVEGLRLAFDDSLALLTSPAASLFKPYFLQDPTAELWSILSGLNPAGEPDTVDGVWASRDGQRALLLLQTVADGADTDGQSLALETVDRAFADVRQEVGATGLSLSVSGPGKFSVQARETIKSEVTRLSLLGMAAIVAVLMLVYRSFRLLALGLLPVLSGALAGIVAVSSVFGTVFGITVGFGLALIGEAVDYATYYFLQSGRIGAEGWRRRYWPTVRLGVLTSVAGFGALLWAGFPGLAQLGLYALVGVVTAAVVTRHVLPTLTPERPAVRDLSRISLWLAQAVQTARRLRWAVWLAAGFAAFYLVSEQGRLWTPDISVLSTASVEDMATDADLRADVGAPDARHLVVVNAMDPQQVLQRAESVMAVLDDLVQHGVLGGYDSPARFLPSHAMQQTRLAALPDRSILAERLAIALEGGAVHPDRLAPFLDEVQAQQGRALLDRPGLDGTAFALLVDALLIEQAQGWRVLMPLHAPQVDGVSGEVDLARVKQALAGTDVLVIDMKAEFDDLYQNYLSEAVTLSLLGLGVITVMLALALRSWKRLATVLLPLALSTLLLIAALHASGERLHLLHLVGLLLVTAVGSNYSLFFDQGGWQDVARDGFTLAAMGVANLTTAIGFGMLAFSTVPVLHAIGITVGPGALLVLFLSAVFSREGPGHD